MKFDWETVKEKIKNNIEENLSSGKPSFSELDVEKGIDLFFKLVIFPTNITKLKGLHNVIFPALQDAYITKKGDIGSLKNIADSIEPYFKKLAIIILEKPANQVESMSLLPLIKLIGINKALTDQVGTGYPMLEKDKIHTFIEKDQYLYQIASSYFTRNEVHLSPNWNEIKVYTYLSDILTICVYSALLHSEKIGSLPKQEFQTAISEQILSNDENKILYDFLSFGNTTTEIKTQVVHAYILHYLHGKGTITVDDIKKACDKYFESSVGKQFYERRLNRLKEQKKIEFVDTTHVKLSPDEEKRLQKAYKDFDEDKELFITYYSELLSKYGAIHHFDPLLEKLSDFFVKNFNIDIAEIYEDDAEVTKEDKLYDDFIGYIHSIVPDQETGKEFFKELLKLCEQSDFIVRVAVSKVIGNLSNPDQFQNYIKNKTRVVYIDTAVVLHLLCTGYIKNPNYNNIYFRIVEELKNFADNNSNIILKFAKPYLSEVAYQLKLALLLIPFEDYAQSKYSTNVFYQFYDYLKINGLLEEEDDSFAKFLANWLYINEDDAYERDSDDIVISNLIGVLSDINVDVENLPFYEKKDFAMQILENVLKANLHAPKPMHVLANDALMVCHLSNIKEHGDEPFFLTWDKTFTEFRKAYKSKFHRDELISWHLFSPSKFLNHMSLMSFKVDSKSITNEYLAILDSLEIHEKTKTLFDNLNRLTDIKNLPKEQRRKYIQLSVNLFNVKEFSYEVSLPESEVRVAILNPFEQIIDSIIKHYHSSDTKLNFDQYRQMQLNELYFVRVAEIIREELKYNVQYQISSFSYLKKVDAVLEEFLEKEKK